MQDFKIPSSLERLDGWCTQKKAQRIYDLTKEIKSELTVESGVFAGKSLIPLALAHKHLNIGKCISFDPLSKNASGEYYDPTDANYIWWNAINYDDIYNKLIKNLHIFDVYNYVDFHRKKSSECINLFTDESIYVFHQDSNHSEEISCLEIELFNSKIKKNGFWIMDDTNWETTKKAQALILTKGFKLYEDHVEWQIFKKL